MENINQAKVNLIIGSILIILGARNSYLYGDLLTPFTLTIFGVCIIYYTIEKIINKNE